MTRPRRDLILKAERLRMALRLRSEGATIRYTLDGTDPSEHSPIYAGPIPFRGFRLTLQARAFRNGYTPSAAASASYGVVIYEEAVVTTIAGDGTEGSRDGTGKNAQFDSPCTVRLDSQGNLVVGELGGAIRKISPAGEVTTLLGYNTISNLFQYGLSLTDLCIDSDNNFYFAADYRISRLDTASQLSGYAGTGIAGFADGPATQAQFGGTCFLALDRDRNLLVADANRVRKITPEGMVSTVVSNTPGTSSFWMGLGVDKTGTLMGVANNGIYRICSSGMVEWFSGGAIEAWVGPV